MGLNLKLEVLTCKSDVKSHSDFCLADKHVVLRILSFCLGKKNDKPGKKNSKSKEKVNSKLA